MSTTENESAVPPEPNPDAATSRTDSSASPESPGAGVRAEMEELRTQVADLTDQLLRAHADRENYRRRVLKEQDDARRFESLRLVRDILPGLDGLQRAIASAEQTGDMASLLDGIRMVASQFRDILRGHGAEPIEADGRPFDPNLHEALTQIPSADVEPMTVMQVVEMGYRMHDRVVRPARVIVSCAPPEA